jgi:hypothetical protein
MEYFTVEVWANMPPVNQGKNDYSQMYKAINDNGEYVAGYSKVNYKYWDDYIYAVMNKRVKANSGMGAIKKFLKWQSTGLDDDWLLCEVPTT